VVTAGGGDSYGFRTTTTIAGIVNPPLQLGSFKGSTVVDLGTTASLLRLAAQSNTGEGLWAGVWYRVTGPQGEPVGWRVAVPPTETVPFGGVRPDNLVNPLELEIMLIPMSSGSQGIGIWRTGKCQTSSTADVAIRHFTGWLLNSPDFSQVGCDGPGWLTGQSSGCLFTSPATCQQQYLYNYCTVGQQCGTCSGPCPTGACQHDYDPTIQKNRTSPLSCNPKYAAPPTFWQLYGRYIIIALVILVALGIIGAFILAWALHGRR